MHDAAPTSPSPTRLDWRARVGLALLALVLYMALAPRVAGEGDSAEFTLALALGGVPHPPGYPLWTLAGSGFVHALHALGAGWAHAANLWSALAAGVAVLLTLALADDLLDVALERAARACVLGAAALAMVALPTFVRAATQAEVYAFEVAWTAGAAWAALRALRALESGALPDGRGAFALGALAGVAFAHRPTMLATALALAVALLAALARRGAQSARVTLLAAAGALVPLASWAWIAWRASHPAAFQWPQLEPGLAALLEHASGAHYAGYLRGHADGGTGAALFARSLGPLLALGAVALALELPRARGAARALIAALAASAVAQGAFVALYGVHDFDFFLLPPLVLVVAVLARAAGRALARAREPLTIAALALTALAFAAVPALLGEARRLDTIAAVDASVREAFEALPFEQGIVIWNSDSYTRLVTLQVLEGRKRALVVLHPGVLTWAPARQAATAKLGFDPLEGLELRTDADLALLAPHLAARTNGAVADFGAWWAARSGAR